MKLCSKHADELQSSLKRKNLTRLISRDVQSARAFLHQWLAGRSLSVDPLVVSVLEIQSKAVEVCGYKNLQPRYAGDHRCPLCESEKALKQELASSWIDNCTDAVLAVCMANGL